MSQFDNRPFKERSPRNNGDPNFNWSGLIFIAAAIVLIGMVFFAHPLGNQQQLKWHEFCDLLEKKQIVSSKPLEVATEDGKVQRIIRGSYYPDPNSEHKQAHDFRVMVDPLVVKDLEKILNDHGLKVAFVSDSNSLGTILQTFLPVGIVLLIVYFLFRQQLKMAGKGALNFGKSKAKMLARDRNKITFKDVAGVDEAKEEVQELVEFLRDPKKFQKLGGRIPKGVLMVGPPGTGKTGRPRCFCL